MIGLMSDAVTVNCVLPSGENIFETYMVMTKNEYGQDEINVFVDNVQGN